MPSGEGGQGCESMKQLESQLVVGFYKPVHISARTTSLKPDTLSYTQHVKLSLETDKASSTREKGRRPFIRRACSCLEQCHFLRNCATVSMKKIDRAADGNKQGVVRHNKAGLEVLRPRLFPR